MIVSETAFKSKLLFMVFTLTSFQWEKCNNENYNEIKVDIIPSLEMSW